MEGFSTSQMLENGCGESQDATSVAEARLSYTIIQIGILLTVNIILMGINVATLANYLWLVAGVYIPDI